MAQTVTVIFQANDCFIADVAYTANADVGGVVPHGIKPAGLGSKAAGGVPSHAWMGQGAAPVSAAIQRVRDAQLVTIDATNITIDVAASTGSAAPVLRVFAVRDLDALSSFAQIIKGATVGAMTAGDSDDDDDSQ